MGYTYYEPLKVWLDPASIADVVSYMQKYLSENPIKDTEEINQIIADYIAAHPEIIGGVQSVNGETGAVVLTASDINTTGTTTIQAVLTSLSSQISDIAQTVTQNTDDISNLKSAFNDNVAFYETLGYIPPSFTNSQFVNGTYANGQWRDTGAYALSRTIHELIPIDDFVVTAETNDYSNLVLTLQLWNSSNAYIGSYRVGGSNGTPISMSTVIQNGSYEILKSEALNTNASAAYITVSIGKLVSGAWVDLPTDLVLDLRNAIGKAQNILDLVGSLSDAIEDNAKTIDLNKLPTYVWGKYIKPDGTLGNASAHKVVSTKIKNVKQIGVHALGNTGVQIAVIEDAEGNVITSLQKPYYYEAETKYDLSLTKDVEYTLFLNFFSYATVPNPYYSTVNLYFSNAVDYAKPQVVDIAKYSSIELPRHSVRKPFALSGKTAAFFGDSITVGVINGDGTQVTTNNYPNGFSAKVGLTPTNKAVSGSRIYVPDGVQAAKILTKLQSVTLSDYDFIFIAGGINDFVAYTVDQMLIGLTELISYVKANFSGDVIWITPINTAKNVADVYNNKKDLNDYISAMTKLIKESDSNYQFSVVQGWEFGFPTLDSDSAYKNAMFGDGELHPSELGYNTLYVPGLLTALC